MAFGTIAVGSSGEATLRISNSGSEPLNVTGMTLPDGGVYSSSWTGGTIAAGSSQTATIRFTPAGALSYNGTLTVNANHTGGRNTIPISGFGDAAVHVDLTGIYDLNAVITSSDPIWGSTEGAREVAVLEFEHSPNTSQLVGTFTEFRFIDRDGKSSAGQKGVVRGSISITGRVVIQLLHEGRNCHWYGEGLLASGQIAGTFGDACHIGGTFTAERRRPE